MNAAYAVDLPMDASHFERGVSDDAQKLGGILREIIQFPDPSAMSSFRGEALSDLTEVYFSAAHPNWDNEGASAVAHSTFEFARQLLALLPSRIAQPEIYAETDGELAFEWDIGPRQVISISVGRDGTLTYAGLMGIRNVSGVDYIGGRLPGTIRAALDAVLSKTQ